MTIELEDTTREFISIDEAKNRDGIRIITPAITVPGPWFESCKSTFYAKGLDFTVVHSSDDGVSDLMLGLEGTQSKLIAWSGQQSLPVVIYNDELPLSTYVSQLRLAERLSPEPSFIPSDAEERIRMFGLANELMGQNGLVWDYRLTMVEAFSGPEVDDNFRTLFGFLGGKYGYSKAAVAEAFARVAASLKIFDAQIKKQKAAGKNYLIGDTLSALDIYWACACGLLAPMDESRCPMASIFRNIYGVLDDACKAALSDDLIAHRDYIYENYLELPITF